MIVYKDLNDIKEDFIIITKSNLENLGKKTIKKVYEILNFCDDDFYLGEIRKKLKKEKDKLDNFLINHIFFNIKTKVKYFNPKTECKIYFEIDDNFKTDKNESDIYPAFNDNLKKFYLEKIKEKIENESLDIDLIFEALSKIELIWDMNEDTYCERKAFLNIYKVFYNDYKELEY